MVLIERERLLELYRKMLMIRRFEEKVAHLFASGRIPGFVHLCIGQEAVAVGVCALLREDDYIVSNHRGHGHMIAKGADVRLMMAELFGKRDGYCGGRGGSMHICDFKIGALGANGIVGGGIPIANGAGFSSRYRGTDQVTVCFFGDGASNQGTFHESLNLSALWKLPVIFVCENNRWAEFTPQSESMCIEDISIRARSYGMPGLTVNGSDLFSVMDGARDAITRAREGGGPTLLECKTFRFRGHYEGDPQKYRNEREYREIQLHDPIGNFKNKVYRERLIEKWELEKIEQDVESIIFEAIKYAEKSPYPEFEMEIERAYA
jgi:pyruvate dehydrogenase E1 component alpha subunit